MGDRKYRQPGYQDYEFEKSEKGGKKKAEPKVGGARWQQAQATGPRSPQMPGAKNLSRCAHCGAELQLLGADPGQCPKCGFELRSCKQCQHFDPRSRFECTEAIPKRIANKEARNKCTFFAIRVRVERETKAGPVKPTDARAAFENLFKK
ncbi:MAG: hypothetical protein ACRD4D_00560 [Candidatus Acidiferrales bacterium]